MNFDAAFTKLIGLDAEGGYVSPEQAAALGDPGGETNMGVSRRSYPMEDIKGMTPERAKLLYSRDYWGPAGCDCVPDELKYPLFSLAVNAGCKTAIRVLQIAAQTDADGVIGPHTLMAMQSMDPKRLLIRFAGAELTMKASLKTWPVFGRGWVLRMANELLEA